MFVYIYLSISIEVVVLQSLPPYCKYTLVKSRVPETSVLGLGSTVGENWLIRQIEKDFSSFFQIFAIYDYFSK